jgi:hypothetical protein
MKTMTTTLGLFLATVIMLPASTAGQDLQTPIPVPSPLWRLPSQAINMEPSWEECTIGVASGRATKDGRPMIWKTRDTDSYDNAIFLNSGYRYRFLAVIDAGNRLNSWISLNEKGFAILNSALYDVPTGSQGLGNGTLMTYAAGTCASVADFKWLLDSTNVTGRRTAACFAVMDSTGAAAIFETGGQQYWMYDAADTLASPRGYILRTNFSVAGGGSTGLVRFRRTTALFDGFYAGDSIMPKTILRYQMRDFADANGVPYPIPFHGTVGGAPYGYIPASETICRIYSASAGVVHGVLPGEAVSASTFWVILGSPATGIALPYWVMGGVPREAADPPKAPLNSAANEIFMKIWGGPTWPQYLNSLLMRDDSGGGLFKHLFLAEDSLLAAADTLLAQLRKGGCEAPTVIRAESVYAASALVALQSASNSIVSVQPGSPVAFVKEYSLQQNYPNPFNPSTTIRYELPRASHVTLTVYDALGREVATLVNTVEGPGYKSVQWNAGAVASGVYFYRLQAGTIVQTKKLMVVR